MPAPRVVVVGSINVDLVVAVSRLPAAGETVAGGEFARHGGGKSANQAVAAARLGAAVSFVGAVGTDEMGDEAVAELAREGIDVTHVSRLPAPTGVALIVVDAAGENQIAVASGANAALTRSHVTTALDALLGRAGATGATPPAATPPAATAPATPLATTPPAATAPATPPATTPPAATAPATPPATTPPAATAPATPPATTPPAATAPATPPATTPPAATAPATTPPAAANAATPADSRAARGVVLLCHEVAADVVSAAASAAAAAGWPVVLNPAPARDLPDATLAVLTPNASEAAELTGRDDPEDAARALVSRTGAAVLITLGGDGALLLEPGGEPVQLPATKVDVVDTTGAGDTVNGALATELAAGRPLADAARFALAAAARSTTAEGARGGMPTRGEVDTA